MLDCVTLSAEGLPPPSPRHVDGWDRHVGARIKAARRDAGLTQTALGDLLGVAYQQVQKYERGANRIGAVVLFRAALALGRDTAWFFEGLAATEPSAPTHG